MAKTNEPDLDMPDIGGIGAAGEDSDFLDFSDIEESAGFGAVPAGWYPMVVTGYRDITTVTPGGKLPVGTKGTQFEFTIDEGFPYAGRKVWNNYWHARQNLPMLKGLATISGQYTTDQLNEGKHSYESLRDGIMWGKVNMLLAIRPARGNYNESNNVVKIAPYDPAAIEGVTQANSDLPG
ncbi:MAG: hypothetical protein ABL876_00015 [Chitinophagaceae bacterium]